MGTQKLTPAQEEVVMQVIYAERLRITGDTVAESEALKLLEELCDDLTLDELFTALGHVASALQQKITTH